MAYRQSQRMQARLADNRQRIVSAARRCISRTGFHGAQMAAIAEAAGLSTGALYRYFPSKAALFVEVLGAGARHEVDLLRAIAARDEPPAQRLRAAVECFTRRALDGPHIAHAFIAEPVDPDVDAERRAQRRALADILRGILQEGIDDGSFPPQDARLSAAAIVGAFNEALIGPTAPTAKRGNGRDEQVGRIADFCVRAVGHTP